MKYTSALLSDARNKLGESVFSKNASGGYIRAKVKPLNPQTANQQQQRANFQTFTKMWRTLSQQQMAGWRALAETVPQKDTLGQTFLLSGAQLFVANNLNLALAFLPPLFDATPQQIPLPTGILSEYLGGTQLGGAVINYWNLSTGATPDAAVVVGKCTPVFSSGISFVPPFFYKQYDSLGAPNADGVAVFLFGAAFAPGFVPGAKFGAAYKLLDPSSGFTSAWVTTTAIYKDFEG